MESAMAEDPNYQEDQLANLTTEDIVRASHILDNDIRILKEDVQRTNLELESNKEKIKENQREIKLNKQLPYLVGNIVELGAAAVNLVTGEKPADVYSGIAAGVLSIMQADAKKDPAVFPDDVHAKKLINQVDRKLVNQTVMTSVYGITYIGARDHIKRRLKERDALSNDAERFGAACYAARTTLIALEEMFQAARNIMNCLGECAKILTLERETEKAAVTTTRE